MYGLFQGNKEKNNRKSYDDGEYPDILQKALERANRYQSDDYYQRSKAVEDIRFCTIPGAQWEDSRFMNEFRNKPRLEFNLVHKKVMDAVTAYLRNQMTITFSPTNGEGGRDLCEVSSKLLRSDMQYSNGMLALINGYKEAVKGGMGAFRLSCRSEDEYSDDEYQRIFFDPIYDAASMVFFDTDAKAQDKSDAKYCFVIHSITTERAKEEYGFIPTPFPMVQNNNINYNNFSTPSDLTYIAEYYVCDVEEYNCFIYQDEFKNKYVYEEDELEYIDEIELMGKKKVGEKKKKRKCVLKYLMSGDKILEDCGKIAGSEIPIIPVYGYYDWIQNTERFMGEGTLSKDCIRLINMTISYMALLNATTPREIPIFLPQQTEGFNDLWAKQNLHNYPYMLINPVRDSLGNIVQPLGPVGEVKPPSLPPATVGALEVADRMLDKILGRREIAEDIKPDISGIALKRIQKNFDDQFFVFLNNMKIAVRRMGEVWRSMSCDVYVESDRKMKIVEKDMRTYSSVDLGEMIIDEDTGELKRKYDFKRFKLDASVEVSYSTETEKETVIESLTSMLQLSQTPEQKDIITSAILMNLTGEGLSDINDYYRMKLVRLGVIEPTDKERKKLEAEAQNQEPSAEQKYLLSESEKSMAQSMKYKADSALSLAKTAEIEAKTKKTESDTAKVLKELFTNTKGVRGE